MNATCVLAESTRRGIKLEARDGKLRVDAPVAAVDPGFRSALLEHKAELLDLIAALDRWGPALENDEPGISIPEDWRSEVASWTMAKWLEWRRRSAELQPPSPSAEQIMDCDWAAYCDLTRPRRVAEHLAESRAEDHATGKPGPFPAMPPPLIGD